MAKPHPASSGKEPLRVLIENAEYSLNNRGDLAMLQITVERLKQHWPHARIGVLTYQPALLRAYVPEAEAISYHGDAAWRGSPSLIGALAARVGPRVTGPMSVGWVEMTHRPRILARRVRNSARALLSRKRNGPTPTEAEPSRVPRVPAAVEQASLVLGLGGGYMTDVDLYQSNRTLDLLERAIARRVPTAMIGQGLGPMENQELLARAGDILPKVDFIGLREGRRGPDLLRRLRVSDDRVVVTGDDAVEFAYERRRPAPGRNIGVCLRIADYSPVAASSRDVVGQVVRRSAAGLSAGLVPLIVSEDRAEDRRSTLPLLAGYPDVTPPIHRFGTSGELAAQVATCRILVTGAYHVAVFAMSQGIPVVGLSASQYYDDKLGGLRALFGDGMEVVTLNQDNLARDLAAAIERAWDRAPEVREHLRASARAQIAASRAGLNRVFQLVEPLAGGVSTSTSNAAPPTLDASTTDRTRATD